MKLNKIKLSYKTILLFILLCILFFTVTYKTQESFLTSVFIQEPITNPNSYQAIVTYSNNNINSFKYFLLKTPNQITSQILFSLSTDLPNNPIVLDKNMKEVSNNMIGNDPLSTSYTYKYNYKSNDNKTRATLTILPMINAMGNKINQTLEIFDSSGNKIRKLVSFDKIPFAGSLQPTTGYIPRNIPFPPVSIDGSGNTSFGSTTIPGGVSEIQNYTITGSGTAPVNR
jgi:hypothetical protein